MESEPAPQTARPVTKRRLRSKAWPAENKFLLDYLIKAKQDGRCSLIEFDRDVLESAAEELRRKGHSEINSSSIKSKINSWKYEWRIYITAVETYDFDLNESTGMLSAGDDKWNELNRRFYDAEYRFRHGPLRYQDELREVFANMFLGTKEEGDKISRSRGKPDYERNLYAAGLMVLEDGETVASLSNERMKIFRAEEVAHSGGMDSSKGESIREPKRRQMTTRNAPCSEIRNIQREDQCKRKAEAPTSELPSDSCNRQEPTSAAEAVPSIAPATYASDLNRPASHALPFVQTLDSNYQGQQHVHDQPPKLHKRHKPTSPVEVVSSMSEPGWVVNLNRQDSRAPPFMQPLDNHYQTQPQVLDRYSNLQTRRNPISGLDVLPSTNGPDWRRFPVNEAIPYLHSLNTYYTTQPQASVRNSLEFPSQPHSHIHMIQSDQGHPQSRHKLSSDTITTSTTSFTPHQANFPLPNKGIQPPHSRPLQPVNPNVSRILYSLPSKSPYQQQDTRYQHMTLGSAPSQHPS